MTDNTIHEKIINIINLFNKGDFDSVLKLNKSLIKRNKNIQYYIIYKAQH